MKRQHFLGSAFIVLIFTLLLSGCSLLPEKQVHYQRFGNGIDMRLTYYARRDRVTRQETRSTILYSALGASDKESAKQILDPLSKRFQGITGLTEKITYGKNYAKEKLTIDYKKVNLKKIKQLPGMYYSNTKSNRISLKKSEEFLKKNKFVKITDNKYKKFTKKELTQRTYSIKDFDKIKLASSSIDDDATTITDLTKQLGRPDSTQKTKSTGEERSMYLWYLTPSKTAYVSVYTVGNRINTKTLNRYQNTDKKINSSVFDSLQNGIAYDTIINTLGEPTRATVFRNGSNTYATLTYRDKNTTKTYTFYFTNEKLISKRESS
ncbi:DUF1307 domain-containing protein [Liquorilactobacillus oeni]|uniref:Lipoprotein n=1 Tax=Liquorilactobacillus oeni DSM 19972 TaxID=1423777 RepID=A0A0R1MBE9_9LACO|nr:DUF1307 domain-containing protein [Liquorilactobacillus oeni]KRL05456.1 hypothetical protein FD46_GL000872 [Liquorilactobacillus oeni DSM 19972]